MKVFIIAREDRKLTGKDGIVRDWYDYTARRHPDDTRINFGSKLIHEVGREHDLNIEKYERKDGQKAYKEFPQD